MSRHRASEGLRPHPLVPPEARARFEINEAPSVECVVENCQAPARLRIDFLPFCRHHAYEVPFLFPVPDGHPGCAVLYTDVLDGVIILSRALVVR